MNLRTICFPQFQYLRLHGAPARIVWINEAGSAGRADAPKTCAVNRAPYYYCGAMTFANVGTLGTVSGKRDELVRHLTRRSETLRQVGCLAYEVGVNEDDPDTVFVVELWENEEAHRSSLTLPEVQASIALARPLLSGAFGGFRFEVVGSPLRD